MRLNVFIPAAGLGKRLQPITHHLPKPLLPILGKPLLEHVIERIASLDAAKIGINLHHLQNQVSSWIVNSKYASQIEMFYEDNLLGTGGAIRNAGLLLSTCTFLVHNTDILSNIDLGMLIKAHEASGNLVTLAVHEYLGLNNLRLDSEGFLIDVVKLSESQTACKGLLRQAAYTGIAVYSPDFIKHIPAGNSGMVSCWLKALASGAKIGTVDVTGTAWKDLGRPESFAEAIWDRLSSQGERVFIHPNSSGCKHVFFQGMGIIESDATVTGPVTLTNSILLPGASVEGTQKAINRRNRIIGPDYSIEIPEPDICDKTWNKDGDSLPEGPEIPQKLIEEVFFGLHAPLLSVSTLSFGGSDRSYYRLRLGSRSAVLMITDKTDPDYKRQLEYSIFFSRLGLPVPRLLAATSTGSSATTMTKQSAIFEDLGDFSLYSWMHCRRPAKDVEDMYKKVLEVIVKMHTYSGTVNDKCSSLKFRNFDYDHLRWESSYFLRELVTNYCQQEIVDHAPLEDELHRLAVEVDRHPKTIIHRDCQSQNIMITQNQSSCLSCLPYLIDYQGARIGPPAYDLASLLWDPYVKIEENLRERLIDYYIKDRKRTEDEDFDQALFRRSILPCLLQRHMQALGAYAFLSIKKGKLYFKKFIPSALNLLHNELEEVKDRFPVLYKLVQTIRTNF